MLKMRQAREALKMTRKELAKRLNVDRTTIYLWETGRRSPHPLRHNAIKKLLGSDALEEVTNENSNL